MGQFYNDRLQFFDGNGVPYANARLYTFDSIATTTPKATYSNNALTTSNGAYVQAGADGVFPQIFAASGEAFFAVLKDAAGATVQQFSFLTSLGAEDATVFERDFGTDGRIQMRGTGGVPRLEFGDPSGDDVGGTGKITGWDGTQGVLLTLDMVTVAVTGSLTVGGSATVDDDLNITNPTSAGSVYAKLASGTATAQTAVDIPLDADFNAYVLEIQYLTAPASPNIGLQLAFDSTPTFKSAPGDYAGANQYLGGTTPGTTSNSTRVDLFPSGIVSGAVLYSRFHLMIDSRAAAETIVSGMVSVINVSGGPVTFWPQGATNAKDYGKATYVRILTAASTISFRWSLLGIPGL